LVRIKFGDLQGDSVFYPRLEVETKYGITLDEAFIDKDTSGLYVSNHTDQTVSIMKDLRLGRLIPIDINEEVEMIASIRPEDEDTFDSSIFDINPEAGRADKREVLGIIKEYRDVFAKDNSELGCTHLVEHSISQSDKRCGIDFLRRSMRLSHAWYKKCWTTEL
jgi:hypothetical protein